MSEIIASTYELLERIGSGGGGVVYLAKHLRLDKKVVLKADKRKITTHPEILRREVDALKDLNHTYIPQVYDYFVENDRVYTVIDYIEGESLDKPLKRGEKFSQPQVIKWACEILEALCYLHEPVHGTPPRGIVHSDIKPANIMLTPSGDIKLIDFNIALALGEENVVGLSAGYASPEHYGLSFSTDVPDKNSKVTENLSYADTETMDDNNETKTMNQETVTMAMHPSNVSTSPKKIVVPDARSDIYSLGATLYHLLSGIRPAKNAREVIPLSEKEISPLVVKIISKAMNPNPDLRYQTAEEMLYDFTHLRENDPRAIKLKKISISVSVILAVILFGSIFTSFVGLKRMETEQKALTLAEYSQNALESGNVDLAKEYALEALAGNNIFTNKYIPQGQKALTDALGVYDLSDGFKAYHTIEMPSETFKITLAPDGKTGAAIYAFSVAVFDTEMGEITSTLPSVKSALADVVFIDNDTIAYGGEKGLTVYNVKSKETLWIGKQATHIAVSADGQTIAGIYRDENFATVYDINGNIQATVGFNGNKQRVVSNDTFADPMDNLMALNNNGQYLAVSFENGALTVFDTINPDGTIEIYNESDYTHFEGGFNGKYLAFSGTTDEISEFAVIDIEALEQTIGFILDSRIGVEADEDNIYISNKSTVVTIDPLTGKQNEVAYTDSDVRLFASDSGNTIAVTEKNEYLFYDIDADLITRYSAGQNEFTFADIEGDYAVVAGRDTPVVRILKKKQYDNADLCSYDKNYTHDEARINESKTRLLLFSYWGFRLYDMDGNVINEVYIPDAENVYDQQYSKKSGNLAVMYNDAFRLYSGETGELICEEDNLKSVFYSKYGVSVFDGNEVRLIDIDTGNVVESGKTEGEFGAYCGIIVDDEFLDGGKLIGSAEINGSYIFTTAKDGICSVYDDKGNKKFEMPVLDNTEAFFTDSEIILSPLHGTPSVYKLKNGEKITDLERDSYLTYITELDDYIVSEYISASGDYYAMLLDKENYETLAYMPCLTDISDNELIFDFDKGIVRRTRIYSIEELINFAYGGEIF